MTLTELLTLVLVAITGIIVGFTAGRAGMYVRIYHLESHLRALLIQLHTIKEFEDTDQVDNQWVQDHLTHILEKDYR